VKYVEGTKPSGQTAGLGTKGKATAVAVNYLTNAETTLMQKSLLASNNQTILASLLPTNTYMRFYIGLATGSEPTAVGVTPFVSADKPGDYAGTLTLTASQP
jgi:hypothetical protein